MDPYDSPLRVPYSSPCNPFTHSLLRSRRRSTHMLLVLVTGRNDKHIAMINPRTMSHVFSPFEIDAIQGPKHQTLEDDGYNERLGFLDLALELSIK